MDEVERIARKVFGLGGMLPMKSGAVHLIPDFRNQTSTVIIFISILLHRKEDRTPEILEKIAWEFEKVGKVTINDQPEKLWRKF